MKARFIDLQKTRLIKGEISRRQFIRSALASGVGVTGALSLAAAAEAEIVPHGGTLRIATRGAALPFAFGSALTEIHPDGVLTGGLAESWSSSPDARDWQFRLREGVRFHSGDVLSAEDAVTSLSAQPLLLAAGMTGITGESAQVVGLSFAEGVPDLPLWLSDPALIVRSASGATTGPYLPLGPSADRFSGWFRGTAHFDSLDLSDEARLEDVVSGHVDLLLRATSAERSEAARLGLVELDPAGLAALLGEGRVCPPRDHAATVAILRPRGT